MKKNISLFIVFLFIFSGSIYPQNAQDLRIDTPVSGNLGRGQEVWYSVRAPRSGFLTVETTGNIDTFLEAYDSHRNLITDDDDSGEGHNAKIDIVVAAGRTYLFKLKGFSDSVSGPFYISASVRPFPNPIELRFGNPVSVNMSPGQEFWYRVRTGNSPLIVTVETSGNAVDTYMEAYTDTYELITSNDDGGEGYNAKIELITEANKTYIFKIRGYNREESGRFTLAANFAAVPQGTGNTIRSMAVPIRPGEVINVFIREPYESRWFRYDVTRTADFAVQTRGNMDTMLFLYDSQGNQLDDDDDSGEDYNALISIRLNPGTYFIEVKGFSDNTGRFTLHAETR